MIVDGTRGYAYVGNSSPAAVVKVALGSGDAPPSRIGALALSGVSRPVVAAGDLAGGYGYFGTDDSPARIVKVRFGTGDELPSSVGMATLNTGESTISACLIDPARGYGWFATSDAPSKIVKVALGAGDAAPGRLEAISLDAADGVPKCAVMEPSGSCALFGCSNGKVVRVALDGALARVGATASGLTNAACAVTDSAGTTAYFGGPGGIARFATGNCTTPPVFADILLDSIAYFSSSISYSSQWAILCDAAQDTACFGVSSGGMTKVALGSGSTAAKILWTSSSLKASWAVYDNVRGYALMGRAGYVDKVAMGQGADAPRVVSSLALYHEGPAIDPGRGYLYVLSGDYVLGTDYVAKIAIGEGESTPTVVSRSADLGWNLLWPVVVYPMIDTDRGYMYYARTGSRQIGKIALGDGDSSPSLVATLELPSTDGYPKYAVIDPDGGHLYMIMSVGATYPAYGTLYSHVVKVALGDGAAAPTRVGSTLLTCEPLHATMDPANHRLYVYSYRGECMEVFDAGQPGEPPVKTGSIPLVNCSLYPGLIDATGHYACLPGYLGVFDGRGMIAKIPLGMRGMTKGTRIDVPEYAAVTDVRYYSHHAGGNVRLAIYNDGHPRTCLWQSHPIANSAADTWITAPISNGTPAGLSLLPGKYWLAFQTDDETMSAGVADGEYGDGFTMAKDYGPFPAAIDGYDTGVTRSKWSMHLNYTPLASCSPDWACFE